MSRKSPAELPTILPPWLRLWALKIWQDQDQADEESESIATLKGADTLWKILTHIKTAKALTRFAKGRKGDVADKASQVKKFLAAACEGHYYSEQKNFLANSTKERELKAVAKASRKLAKQIRGSTEFCPHADSVKYLLERSLSQDATGFMVSHRAGLRGGKYLITNPSLSKPPSTGKARSVPLRLPDLLDAFSEDLKEQIAITKRPKKKSGGRNAKANYQIDRLAWKCKAIFKKVPDSLIAHTVSAITGEDIDVSRVSKRT